MPYVARRRALEPFDTWRSMKAGAEARYWDGLALAVAGASREAGAVYLFGYVAEMLLKTAYCEYTGIADTAPLYPALRSDVLSPTTPVWRGATTGGGNPDLHSLRGLSEFLIDTRAIPGDMDAAVAGALQFHVAQIESHFEVAMRYSGLPAMPEELEETLASVDWICRNYDRLWS